MRITSTHNRRLRAVAALRDHQTRLQLGKTIVDGVREVQQALAKPGCVLELYWLPEECQSPRHRTLLSTAQQQGIAPVELSPAAFRRLSYGERSEGVIAVAQVPCSRLEAIPVEHAPLVLVLEGVEKPGNIGAVARTADAVGAGLVLADARTDAFNPNAIRASLGTIFHVPVAEAPAAQVVAWLRHHGYTIVAAVVDAHQLVWEAELTGSVALVLGNEALGLSFLWRATDVLQVKLPMHGRGDSLNVSVTAAVLAYEWLRQQTTRRP